MAQQSLFDRPAIINLGEALRDAGCQAVLEHAGDWKDEARKVFLAMGQQELTGEDIRRECEARGVRPHHANAWGAFVLGLVREGYLESTGRIVPMRDPRSHARKTQLYRRVR